MNTQENDQAESVLRQVLAEHRVQTSGRYLWRLSRSSLAGLLDASTKGPVARADVGRVAGLIHDLGIKTLAYKSFNVAALGVGLILTSIGLFWPAFNRGSNATTAGTIQSAITAAGGLSLVIHRMYKKKQTQVEDAMRRTLFADEDVEAKVARLLELAPTIDTGVDLSTLKEPAADSKPKKEGHA